MRLRSVTFASFCCCLLTIAGGIALANERGGIAAEKDWEELVQYLYEGDAVQQAAAAKELSQPDAASPLVATLLAYQLRQETYDKERDLALVTALAQMGETAKAAAPQLAVWLRRQGDNKPVKKLDALGKIFPQHASLARLALQPGPTGQAALLLLGDKEPESSQALQLLTAGLAHPRVEIRRAACQAIHTYTFSAFHSDAMLATDSLIICLQDVDPQVRAAAVTALADLETFLAEPVTRRYDGVLQRKIGRRVPDKAVPAIARATQDPVLHVAVRAAHALRHGDPVVVEAIIGPLIAGLQSEHRVLRRLAVEAFQEIGPAANDALPALRVELMLERTDSLDTWIRADVARAIARIAPAEQGVPLLLAAWNETRMYPGTLVTAIGGYGASHPLVVPFLLEAATHGHSVAKHAKVVQKIALSALGRVRPVTAQTVGCLIEHVLGPDLDLRWVAVRALENVGTADPRVIPALLEAARLPDRDGQHQSKAIAALRYIGPADQTIEGLRQLLKDPSPNIRSQSARTLGIFGVAAKAAVPDLIALLQDGKPHVRDAAFQALCSIGAAARTAIPHLVREMERPQRSRGIHPVMAMTQIGPAAVPELVRSMRRQAAKQGDSPAADVLRRLGPQAVDAVPELIEMLDDDSNLLRLRAVFVLREIGPDAEAAVPRLATFLQKEPDPLDAPNRSTVQAALAAIGGPAVLLLAEDLPETIELLRRMNTRAKAALPALEVLLSPAEENDVRYAAAEAMASIGGDVRLLLPVLQEMLQSSSPTVRVQAIQAMQHLALRDRTRGVVTALRQSLDDPDQTVRFAAAQSLLAVFGATAQETLPVFHEMLLGKPDYRNPLAAANAVILLLGEGEAGG
ncbi:HEAT repeat domain-containing protein [Lignipirellula cremea]|uniref:HEAT repeat protein n=1 Tax=Lignipirellula cremea TaxID=2528010 RepID=A0A518DZ33_9BACT|nr:HEAT repeat domain-containing protein [Lignipirellula cremea]QDU97103.1 HEAT repeat protein [Lignipirellula cremea]